jgi:hypothetical protein
MNSQQDGKVLVNNQFNTPINLYSEQNIAETLSAQSEVLAGGAIGVDFKKNEKPYNCEESEVYKMLKEVENEPPTANEASLRATGNPVSSIPITNYAPPQQSPTQQSLLKSVRAPETRPESSAPGGHNPNLCSECERLIVGVFVRIKDKNMHVDCFKCATCGQSLKNIGYFNINNKLYCDVHAKSVAKAHPPAPGLEPYTTFKPTPRTPMTNFGAPIPSAAKTIPINVNKPFSYMKQPSVDTYAANVAPMPYHHSPTQTHHVTAPKSPIKTPTQQQLFSSSSSSTTTGGTKSSQIFESKSSSYSETITKSGGAKFVWPPPRTEDEVMMGSDVATTIPIQQQQSSYSSSSSVQNISGYGSSGVASTNYSAPAPSLPAYAPPLQTYSAPAPAPSYTPFGSSGTPYKPVAPPKPGTNYGRLPTTPYKPLASLLTTASKPAPPPTYQAPAPAPAPAAPAFGGPSSYGGGLQAGPPLAARGKGQMGRGIFPTRGKGILTQPGPRIAVCGMCYKQIRGPFITASGGKIYCPDHFKCATPNCHRPLIDIGYVEEKGALYCEFCWESYLAPECGKCRRRIKNECLNAIGQHFHPQCFICTHCGTTFGNNPFYLEDGRPYCDKDWNEMFTTKCYACGFPIEAGDRWVEAMNNNYHSQCFNCSACKKNLEGQSFLAKAGRPFCKQHARG